MYVFISIILLYKFRRSRNAENTPHTLIFIFAYNKFNTIQKTQKLRLILGKYFPKYEYVYYTLYYPIPTYARLQYNIQELKIQPRNLIYSIRSLE